MPRHRQYDEDEVLNAAMRVFWKDGYGASTRQLAEAMGINQYSVYASFESKSALFERALDHYLEDVVEASVLLPLRSQKAALPELRAFFEGFVRTKRLDAPDGCFICNTMIGGAEQTQPVQRIIERYRNLVTKAFSRALANTFPKMPKTVVRARCEFLFAALLGLLVQKKMGAEGRPVQVLVDEIMDAAQRDFK